MFSYYIRGVKHLKKRRNINRVYVIFFNALPLGRRVVFGAIGAFAIFLGTLYYCGFAKV